MITPRSALKFDLFADASRKRKIDEVGDPLQTIAQHIDFGELASLVDGLLAQADGHKGGRPAYPAEVMVRRGDNRLSIEGMKFIFSSKKDLSFQFMKRYQLHRLRGR